MPGIRLGLDVFSLRSQALSPFAVLDWCAARGIGLVHFSEPRLIGAIDPDSLARLRAHADGLAVQLEVGMLSICPSATIFNAAAGTAETQLTAMSEVARVLGSPIVRCVVGSFRDRTAPGGIEARIADAVTVLRSVRTRGDRRRPEDRGREPAGDLQARELAGWSRGRDGRSRRLPDAGNALWAMEDPHFTLQTLGPMY